MNTLFRAWAAVALGFLSLSIASAQTPSYRLPDMEPAPTGPVLYAPASQPMSMPAGMSQSMPTRAPTGVPVSMPVSMPVESEPYSMMPPAPPPSIEARLQAIEQQLATPAAPAKPAATLPSVKVSGAFQADIGWFGQDETSLDTFGRIPDGADFRRARLGVNGNVTEQVSYFFQMDFGAVGRPTFTDVWLAINDVPIFGNIKIGQWKHPFSLEVVSSYRYTTFMERSLLFQPLTPFRHVGIGFYDWSEDLNTTWAASAIRTGQDQYGGSISTDGGYGMVGRLTHLLFWDEATDGRSYLHVGGAYYLNAPPNDRTRFRSIPGSSGQAIPGALNGTPYFVDTLTFDANLVNTFGSELLWVAGPLSVQSEAMAAVIDRPAADTLLLGGAYLQVGYFLTGEHRPYDRKAGAIDRIKPFEDFFWVRNCEGQGEYGMGAWEVAARISYLNLNDDDIRGGELTDLTLGVNWYLNPYCKFVANYIHAFLDDPTTGKSGTDIVALRAQLDF
jgi:phosphate-selective porin OprO/OprP